MAFLIGTDEAGYGPNLGPLVISATAWHVDDNAIDCDLYKTLHEIVDVTPVDSESKRITIADSKTVYKPGGGLAGLERTVLPVLRSIGLQLNSWRDIWPALAGIEPQALDKIPWYADFDCPLPIDAEPEQLDKRATQIATALKKAGVQLLAARSAVVFPDQFNDQVDNSGSKGEMLSMTTLHLVRSLLHQIEAHDHATQVVCDKHGGRDKYVAMLQTVFHEWWVTVLSESRQESSYRLGVNEPSVEFRFRAKGESFLPAALASMFSKYLRELSMLAFNAYWSKHVPDLKPTAGYPVDAKRFRRDIAHVEKKLKISERMLWRSR